MQPMLAAGVWGEADIQDNSTELQSYWPWAALTCKYHVNGGFSPSVCKFPSEAKVM